MPTYLIVDVGKAAEMIQRLHGLYFRNVPPRRLAKHVVGTYRKTDLKRDYMHFAVFAYQCDYFPENMRDRFNAVYELKGKKWVVRRYEGMVAHNWRDPEEFIAKIKSTFSNTQLVQMALGYNLGLTCEGVLNALMENTDVSSSFAGQTIDALEQTRNFSIDTQLLNVEAYFGVALEGDLFREIMRARSYITLRTLAAYLYDNYEAMRFKEERSPFPDRDTASTRPDNQVYERLVEQLVEKDKIDPSPLHKAFNEEAFEDCFAKLMDLNTDLTSEQSWLIQVDDGVGGFEPLVHLRCSYEDALKASCFLMPVYERVVEYGNKVHDYVRIEAIPTAAS